MILIKYPTRSRPQQFLKIIDLYEKSAMNKDDLYWLVAIDSDDKSMTPKILHEAKKRLNGRLTIFTAKHEGKVDAINSGIQGVQIEWDILINAADDMIPYVSGWDVRIKLKMKQGFPDLDGCLWFYDGTQKNICTMAIMGRKAYESQGYIYHPSYVSLWCDQEYTKVWLKKRKLIKSMDILFEHIHPASLTKSKKLPRDPLYERNEDRETMWKPDERNFKNRLKQGFP